MPCANDPSGARAHALPDPLNSFVASISGPPLFSSVYLKQFETHDTPDLPAITLWTPPDDWRRILSPSLKSRLIATLIENLQQQKSHFLGARFETFWKTFFEIHPAYDLIAHNLQILIPDNKHGHTHTLGELDFIVRETASGVTFHIETAIKFYLGVPNAHDGPESTPSPLARNRWIGPNRIDRLDKKLMRMIGHQLRITHTDAGQSALRQISALPLRPALLIRGALHQPLSIPEEETFVPEAGLHIDQRKFWTRLSCIQSAVARMEQKHDIVGWEILDKKDWLKNESPTGNPCQINALFAALSEKVNSQNRPWLLAGYGQRTAAHQEVRLFVTPDTWPSNPRQPCSPPV